MNSNKTAELTEKTYDNNNKQLILWVSSITGNTKSIAETLIIRLLELGYEPRIRTAKDTMTRELLEKYHLKPADDAYISANDKTPVILCFWCRRGSMDDLSLDFLKNLQKRKILVYGTMGSYPESEYGQKVKISVKDLVGKENELVGLYLCRGKIDIRRSEKRRNLPKDHRHYLDDESWQRHLSSRSHPDEKDKKGAATFLEENVAALFS